ncbi:MAG TPA: nucleotidyltransferase domain-containing protein [Candidatus Nanoarchaeia archaeon]|nr:nucleotidyltransferase domain-containing protein [Candidatus Nanoarchaeia archaeon]
MLENWPKRWDSHWIKENNIWDIVVYGSYIRGKSKAKEIDIAVILDKTLPIKKKWELSQELKKKMSLKDKILDIKTLDLKDMVNPGNLNREAILAEGYSLIKKDYLAERFGFKAMAQVEYSLNKLTPAKQKMFYYALQGRKKGTGMLSRLGGRIISKGVLEVPTKEYEEINSLLIEQGIPYRTTFLLRYRILH